MPFPSLPSRGQNPWYDERTAWDEYVESALDNLIALSVDAHDFGATGNGTTDDTAAIQAAVNSAPLFGIVSFRPGATYHVSSGVILNRPVVLEGNGATFIKRSTSSNRLMFTNSSVSGATGYGAGGSDVTIRNMTIRGDYTVALASSKDPIVTFHHVSRININNVTFTQGMGHYIDLLGCNAVKIDNCKFRGIRNDVGREYNEAIQVDSSTYEGASNKTEPLNTYDGLPTRDVQVSRCEFTNATISATVYPLPVALGSHAGALETDEGYYADIWFVNNHVHGWSDVPTVWFGWIHLPGSRRVHISGNTFQWEGPPVVGAISAICAAPLPYVIPVSQLTSPTPAKVLLNRPPLEWTVEGNIISGFGAVSGGGYGAIDVRSTGGPSRIVIQSNTVTDGGSSAFRTNTVSDIIVQGNSFTTNGSVSVFLEVTSGVVSDNVITQNGSGHAVRGTTCTDLVISGNRIQSGTTGIRLIANTSSVISTNSIVGYSDAGIVVGNNDDSVASTDVLVFGNRCRTTSGSTSIRFGNLSTRGMRYGNRLRDGGAITDTGTGSITTATDSTA